MNTGICFFKSKRIQFAMDNKKKCTKTLLPIDHSLIFLHLKNNFAFLFFRKSVPSVGRPRQPVLCVSPGGTDRLLLLRACDYVQQAVTDALSEVWTPGIQVSLFLLFHRYFS